MVLWRDAKSREQQGLTVATLNNVRPVRNFLTHVDAGPGAPCRRTPGGIEGVWK